MVFNQSNIAIYNKYIIEPETKDTVTLSNNLALTNAKEILNRIHFTDGVTINTNYDQDCSAKGVINKTASRATRFGDWSPINKFQSEFMTKKLDFKHSPELLRKQDSFNTNVFKRRKRKKQNSLPFTR